MMNVAAVPQQRHSLAVVYLARGADAEPFDRFRAFAKSYQGYPAGAEHDLFVIYKGFQGSDDLDEARRVFATLSHTPIHVDDDNFDLGAFRRAAERIPHQQLCFLNSHAEPACQD